MPEASLNPPKEEQHAQPALAFYRDVLVSLSRAGIPFLVGGAYSINYYTGINRDTKDLDLFIRRRDIESIGEALQQAGYRTELTFPHWLAKVRSNGDLVDLIFSSGNGVSEVDDEWFSHAPTAEVLNVQAKICPAEETIWSKAFIMERERYDGADIAHLLHACSRDLDWQRLMRRFGPAWRVLLSHLTLFGFIYPHDRNLVPAWVMNELLERLRQEIESAPPDGQVCGGTLLSREQYLVDIEEQGYRDARLAPLGNMTEREVGIWTDAIQGQEGQGEQGSQGAQH